MTAPVTVQTPLSQRGTVGNVQTTIQPVDSEEVNMLNSFYSYIWQTQGKAAADKWAENIVQRYQPVQDYPDFGFGE
jgi:hypothetical protein